MRPPLLPQVLLLVLAAGCGDTKTLSLLGGSQKVVPDAGANKPDAATTACRTDTDCAAPKAFCDTLTNLCVQCMSNDDCTTRVCNLVSHSCSGCLTNVDCSGTTPICDGDDRKCVECTSAAQCARGEVCAFEAHRCAPACQTNMDCAGSGHPICAAASRVCVECTTDADCNAMNLEPHCDLRFGACVECLSDVDCPTGHCEILENRCVECTSDDHCDGRVCDGFICRG